MKTAAILRNVLLRYDNLETDYARTERFWNALDPDLLDRYAVTDGKIMMFQPFLMCLPGNCLRYVKPRNTSL